MPKVNRWKTSQSRWRQRALAAAQVLFVQKGQPGLTCPEATLNFAELRTDFAVSTRRRKHAAVASGCRLPTDRKGHLRMSNHFTGLSLGPPLGDQRLDLCDLYTFVSPSDPSRTVIILNANPLAEALHPDAIYRVGIDNDGDLLNDIAFSYVFSEPVDGRQTVDVYLAVDEEAEEPEAVGSKIFEAVEVSFGTEPIVATSGSFTFFAGARSDAFFFDFDGVKALFDTSGTRNFTSYNQPRPETPWTGVDSNTQANVCSMVIEMPTS